MDDVNRLSGEIRSSYVGHRSGLPNEVGSILPGSFDPSSGLSPEVMCAISALSGLVLACLPRAEPEYRPGVGVQVQPMTGMEVISGAPAM